ncbi:MAG: hypothetical protein JWN44_5700 [Myxococcales bacterium]|nr:hypothetical protein [Myxococcales bacterium]
MRFLPLVFATFAAFAAIAPSTARAQAEPAPEGYIPPGKTEPEAPPPSPLKWHIGADGRAPIAFRVPPGLPTVGWGAGAQVTRALIDLRRIRFGAGLDFGYARFSPDFVVRQPDTSHHLAHMTFAAIAVFDAIVGRLRPWLTAGVGLSAAWYFQPPPPGGTGPLTEVQTVVPVVQLELGLSVEVYRGIDIGVAGHLDLTFSSLSVGSPPFAVFDGGFFSPKLEVGFRF